VEVSVLIWAMITRGERRYAPRPIEAVQSEAVRAAWRLDRSRIQCFLARPPGRRGIYAALHPAVDRYAEQLGFWIDLDEQGLGKV
jgi:hypothetical protein